MYLVVVNEFRFKPLINGKEKFKSYLRIHALLSKSDRLGEKRITSN